ncbi:MAG: type III pantothenate kinase [Bacteroidetes bacterium]|jgi:type III pantothenate kinase|nr:type III pantothenate kinase [Bacteroidota bacterium]
MILALDFGNSQLKAGLFKNAEAEPYRVITLPYKGLEGAFDQLLHDISSSFTCMYSSSLPPGHEALRVLGRVPAATPLSHTLHLPFRTAYRTPHTLGLDRIAACAGAIALGYPLPLLVVDAGTCITYDIIDETHTHQGGAISPGIAMRLKAMHHYAPALPLISHRDDFQPFAIGKTTADSLLEGAIGGVVLEIQGFAATYGKQKALTTVLTGGSSGYLAGKLESGIFAAPNLVLVGLCKINRLNAI